LITAAVAGFLGLLALSAAIRNGRRWRMGRLVERLSNDPALAAFAPEPDMAPPRTPAATVPPLEVRIVKARKMPKVRVKLRRVTLDQNVVGHRPMQVAYLRLFENQPRTRTFLQSAWREFGYVHLLRSAGSVGRAEYRRARESGDVGALFVSSPERLLDEFRRAGDSPFGKGRHKLRNICTAVVRVRDKYGSYPVRAVLCHGKFWKAAVDMLLDRVDLVALDLSGLSPENVGTRYELQRVLDRYPIERVVFLADPHSDLRFLAAVLRESWSQMAAGSPNATPTPRLALVAITDYVQRREVRTSQGPQGQTTTTQVQVRLVARASHTRRVAMQAQERVDGSRNAGASFVR
jgi:hypothetical protein